MRDHLVSYLRLLGFSVCTLAVALCMRLAPAHAAMPAPEPRFSVPPPEAGMTTADELLSEDEHIDVLEAQLTALSAEIANLGKALEVLGLLPDHPDLFIPVLLADIASPSEGARRFAPLMATQHAGLGALVPKGREAIDLGALRAGYDAPAHMLRLDRDFAGDETIAALCVELSALAGAPRVAAPIRGW